ncbi:MAG TPA: tRNA epoxyqueuosine(34) reductase QueG [Tepidisphaeraceae bacterium]|jgi:epoxyqueuosine reductase|nr:tRNA epoxyqueuosine(34) reductase QueG [Tepidisphaeraceae bacterium]
MPPQDEIARQLAAEIKSQARQLGFDLVGIAPAQPSAYRDYLRQWLDTGQAGTMHWLANRFDERTDPRTYLPGARSVICAAMNYHTPLTDFPAESTGRIARYALGTDYHELIKTKLHHLSDWLRQAVPNAQTRAAVDTAPVMEKELAHLAGVGWIGKNTCLINERIGSWTLLGEIITTADLPPDEPAIDRCGTCRRCLDACPTQAITAPYQLDARRCISYLTIEHRENIPADLQSQIGNWLYGCDICQDVCPWNREPPIAIGPELTPRFPTGTLSPSEVIDWSPEDYQKKLKGSAMKRVKLPMLQRNARIVDQNSRDPQ